MLQLFADIKLYATLESLTERTHVKFLADHTTATVWSAIGTWLRSWRTWLSDTAAFKNLCS